MTTYLLEGPPGDNYPETFPGRLTLNPRTSLPMVTPGEGRLGAMLVSLLPIEAAVDIGGQGAVVPYWRRLTLHSAAGSESS